MQEENKKLHYLNYIFCISKNTVWFGMKYIPILLITYAIAYLLTGPVFHIVYGWCNGKMAGLSSDAELTGSGALRVSQTITTVTLFSARLVYLAGLGFYIYAVAKKVYVSQKNRE